MVHYDIVGVNYWYDRHPRWDANFLTVGTQYKMLDDETGKEEYKELTFIIKRDHGLLAYVEEIMDGFNGLLEHPWIVKDFDSDIVDFTEHILGHIIVQQYLYRHHVDRNQKQFWTRLPAENAEYIKAKFITKPYLSHVSEAGWHILAKAVVSDMLHRNDKGELYFEGYNLSGIEERIFMEQFLEKHNICWPKYNIFNNSVEVEYEVMVEFTVSAVDFFKEELPDVDIDWAMDMDTIKVIADYTSDSRYGLILSTTEDLETDTGKIFDVMIGKGDVNLICLDCQNCCANDIHNSLEMQYKVPIRYNLEDNRYIIKASDVLINIDFNSSGDKCLWVYIPEENRVMDIASYEFKDFLETNNIIKLFLIGFFECQSLIN